MHGGGELRAISKNVSILDTMDMLCPGSANIVIQTHMLMPGVIVEQVMYVLEQRQGGGRKVREL
jgi:hypothetical protein